MPTRRAFTFVEILIVVVIVAVLAAISIPRMSGTFKRARGQAAARDLTGALRYARHFAVLRGDGCEIVIDPRAASYELRKVHIDVNGEAAEERPGSDRRERDRDSAVKLADEFRGARYLPQGVFFTLVHSAAPPTRRGLPRIIFYPDGSATAGKIGVQTEEGKAYRIDIYRTTGLAKVENGQPIIPRDLRPAFYEPDYVLYQKVK